MTREQIWSIIKSLVGITIVAGLLTVAVTGKFFVWYWFLGFFVAQFVLWQIVAFVIERFVLAKFMSNLANANSVMQKTIFEQTLPLNCAYCNTVNNNVPIIVSQENSFKCFQCGQENAVYMKFYAARRTTPVVQKTEAELLEKGLPKDESVSP